MFSYDLDDAVEIHLPTSWTPTIDALAAVDYSSDYLLEYLGVLVIALAHLDKTWSQNPVLIRRRTLITAQAKVSSGSVVRSVRS